MATVQTIDWFLCNKNINLHCVKVKLSDQSIQDFIPKAVIWRNYKSNLKIKKMHGLILSLSKKNAVNKYVFQSKNKDTRELTMDADLMTLFLNSLYFTVSDTSELTVEMKKFEVSYPFNNVCKLNALKTFLRCPGCLLNVLTLLCLLC